MRALLLLISIVVLAGCSSPTLQPPKYYVLNGTPTFSSSDEGRIPVNVRSVALSEYLQSSNIVFQVSDHELFFSTNHLWAEPLQVGIKKVLTNSLSKSVDFQTRPVQLDVSVDYFHIVDQDAVILSGSYRLDSGAGRTVVKERFSLREPLNNSGYEYAVSVMSSILKSLSAQVEASMSAHAEQLSTNEVGG